MKQLLMMLQRASLVIFFMTISQALLAQTFSISGILVNSQGNVVPAASIIISQRSDSTYVKGIISGEDGHFIVQDIQPGAYVLYIQHLLCEKKSIPVSVTGNTELGEISLVEKENALEEISVKATRPIVKMEGNVLSYDAKAISEKKVHTNALEVLGDVPGLLLKSNSIELVGARNLNIAINGNPTTLNFEQVLNMLKSMPNTSIKEVQVMYAPPAKYNVKGALINIVLTKAKNNEINGSVHAGYRQRRNAGAFGGCNLQYAKDKWDVNVLYNYDDDPVNPLNEIDIDHTYQDTLYQIEQDMELLHKAKEHLVQLSSNYQVDSLQTLSLSYSGNFSNNDGTSHTWATFASENHTYTERDAITSKSSENLHNLKVDYEWANKLNVGADYTYYSSPSDNYYHSIVESVSSQFMTSSNQTIHKWMAYANHSFSIKSIHCSYGANYAYTGNQNYYKYYNKADGVYGLDESQSTENDFKEEAISGFISLAKQFSSHFSLDLTLKGEFDRMQKDAAGTSIDIWNTFYVYPGINVSFRPGEKMEHIFQWAVNSYTTYPTYWEISPSTWYTNQYMLIKGNPELKPSQTYATSLTYIFKRKYTVIISNEYTHNLISQIPFASNESFNTVARTENVDFQNDISCMFVVPFSLGGSVQVTPNAGYLHRRMKKESPEDQAFDRQKGIFIFQCDNAITLLEKQGLKANIGGYYYGAGIQGIYDFEPSFGVSMGISCNFFKDKAVLSIQVDDLFNSEIPGLNIDFKNQKSRYNLDQDTRVLKATFRYNFGKPVQKKKVEFDDSRFKRMN